LPQQGLVRRLDRRFASPVAGLRIARDAIQEQRPAKQGPEARLVKGFERQRKANFALRRRRIARMREDVTGAIPPKASFWKAPCSRRHDPMAQPHSSEANATASPDPGGR